MSDAIREAFEVLERVSNYASVPFELMTQFADDVDTVKAALQSQTAPAVPEGWKAKVLKLCSAVENDEDLPPVKYALKCGRLINEVKDMLAAAPQPDHSPDAGKVVQESPAGWIWDAYGSRHFTYGCHHKEVLEADGLTLTPVYTHPAQPRNEVQAEALEEYAKALDQVFASAQEANANNCPAWHAGQFAKDARKFAARLRASQQEWGEGHE